MTRTTLSLSIVFLVSTLVISDEVNSGESKEAMHKVLKDYIGLYRADSLDQWKLLFHPSVTVVFPADDGSTNVRNLEEFFQRQKNYFATRKSISERLENMQVFEGRRIARVVADFIFIDEGIEKSGKLGLHLVEGNDGWKIIAVVFSYN
ncbi:nuclear transport factor 2 family protein [bacterium]|nr:nuclear transport factor 2 family protein [bacterium]